MRTNRLNVHKPSARNWDAQTAAALLRNDQGGVSAHAEYRREDYVFARTQSPAMRLLEWEDRVKPLKLSLIHISEVERAIAQAYIDEKAARAMRDAQPRIDAALERARPEIDRAIAEMDKAKIDLKIRESVDKALKRVEVRIEARDAAKNGAEPDVDMEKSETPDDN